MHISFSFLLFLQPPPLSSESEGEIRSSRKRRHEEGHSSSKTKKHKVKGGNHSYIYNIYIYTHEIIFIALPPIVLSKITSHQVPVKERYGHARQRRDLIAMTMTSQINCTKQFTKRLVFV